MGCDMAGRARGVFVGQSAALQEAYMLAVRRGLSVTRLRTAAEALAVVAVAQPEFMVTDYVLPDCDGIDLYNRLSLETSLPVMIITPSERNWLEVATAGDDLVAVASPVGVQRQMDSFLTNLVFRREKGIVAAGGLELDLRQRCLTWGGNRVPLTRKLATVMRALLVRPGELVRREELVYALDMGGSRMERSVDYHIKRLRRLLLDLGCRRWAIESVYGLGYRLKPLGEEVGHGG